MTWDQLNRRAAAVDGGVPWVVGMRWLRWVKYGFDTEPDEPDGYWQDGLSLAWGFSFNDEITDVYRIERRGEGAPFGAVPDLQHAGTRGILRAALGSPSVRMDRITNSEHACEVLDESGRYQLAFGTGSTREQAEAAALVALAEARGKWGPA